MRRRKILIGLLFLLIAYFTFNAYCSSTDVEFTLNKDKYVGLGDYINITIKAPTLNLNNRTSEHLVVQVYTNDDSKEFSIDLYETKTDSGIFSGRLQLSLAENNPKLKTVKVRNGIEIFVKYKNLINKATWQPDDAAIKLDKKIYNGYGECPKLTLTDNDLNLNPYIQEEVDVFVNSISDTKGIHVRLIEEKADSGTFTGAFEFSQTESYDSLDKLLISYGDTIAVTYNDATCISGKTEARTSSAIWRPSTGIVRFNKSSYIGLYSTAVVSVSDQDLNLRSGYRDVARIRITSKSDPQGFALLVYETGANTGLFSGSIKFSTDNSDSDKKTIRISGNDNIVASYIDERTADNKANAAITAASSFQFSEAKIQTSAINDEGTGNMLVIIIEDPDVNNPVIQDKIIAKVGSGNSYDDLTLHLVETGTNTGKFQFKLYFTKNETGGRSLQLSEIDKINIKYIDNTNPTEDVKEIVKTINWTFQSTILTMDKEAYIGYNSSAKILLSNMDLNKDFNRIDVVDVKVGSLSSGGIRLELKETGGDSGEFTGTLYFGKSSSNNERVIKVKGEDTVDIIYTNSNDKNDFVECSAVWSPQNGQVTLDKQVYKGSNAPVKIAVMDWDIAENSKERDETSIIAKVLGSARYIHVTLTETRSNSGIFTGTLYIDGKGGNRPSIRLKPGDKLEIVYTDKDTLSGSEEDRIVYADWIE